MKIELVLAAVVAAGVASVAATVAVGSALKEATVTPHPYEAGLHHAEAEAAQRRVAAPKGGTPIVSPVCDLEAGPCRATAGPYEIGLDLGPRPLRTMSELAARVELRRAGAPVDGARVSLAFDMRGMAMGPNRRTLAGTGGGRYEGKAVLVRCPSGRKEWVATVVAGEEGAAPAARFDFAVAE